MHTKLDTSNPYGCNRYGFAWQNIPAEGTAHLDFGCGDGRFLKNLASKGIKCLAGDIPSVDPVNKGTTTSSATHPCHHILLGAGIPIVESLANLDKLTANRFYFLCLPLNIVGSEGAPARAVAMELT